MALGKPFLATWSQVGTQLRLYRMDNNDVFQLINQASLPAQVDAPSFSLDFLENADVLSVQYPILSTRQALQAFNMSLALLGGNANILTLSNFKSAQFNPRVKTAFVDNPTNTAPIGFRISDTGVITSSAGYAPNVALNDLPQRPKYAFHPNGLYAHRAWLSGTTTSRLLYNFQATGSATYPALDAAANILTALTGVASVFSATGDLLYILDTNGTIRISRFNAPSTIAPTAAVVQAAFEGNIGSIVETGLGNGERIYTSHQGSMVFAVFNNAGVYTTVVFDRVNDTLVRRQQINAFGAQLSISGDDKYLIDAISRKAYHFETGVYVDVSASVMVNINAGALVQGMSAHFDTVDGIPHLFRSALANMLACGIDYSNLRLRLLNPSADVNPFSTTIAQAVRTYQVTDVNMPATGLPLTGAVFEPDRLVADPVDFIPSANVTYRYAVIVDQTNDRPLMWIDYGGPVVAESLSGVRFLFDDPGLVLFSRT